MRRLFSLLHLDMINTGDTARAYATVTVADTAKGLLDNYSNGQRGEAYAEVYATTKMIALMELAAGRLLQSIQSPGELSVGVDVQVKHLAPTEPGQQVEAIATYLGLEGKLYKFKVEAFDELGKIGEGLHTRAIIQVHKFAEKIAKRKAAKDT